MPVTGFQNYLESCIPNQDVLTPRHMAKCVIIIILDSCGVGALPDAARYGDEGCNTLGNIAKSQRGQ